VEFSIVLSVPVGSLTRISRRNRNNPMTEGPFGVPLSYGGLASATFSCMILHMKPTDGPIGKERECQKQDQQRFGRMKPQECDG